MTRDERHKLIDLLTDEEFEIVSRALDVLEGTQKEDSQTVKQDPD